MGRRNLTGGHDGESRPVTVRLTGPDWRLLYQLKAYWGEAADSAVLRRVLRELSERMREELDQASRERHSQPKNQAGRHRRARPTASNDAG